MNGNRKSILLSSLFLVISGIAYTGVSVASYSGVEPSVKEQKVIYAEQCAEQDKIDGKCAQK